MGTTVNISFSTLSYSMGTTTTCSAGGRTYTFNGGLTGPDVLVVDHPGVSGSVYYYQVRIIYGLIAVDGWNSNTIITTNFDSDPTSTPFTDQLGNTATRVCNNNNWN